MQNLKNTQFVVVKQLLSQLLLSRQDLQVH